jgi:iron(III) transport system ATP-binding protein
MSLLCLNNLSKRYKTGREMAVDNVSFRMEKGEILALLGESGSGKTTLLRMIAGFEKPTSGEVFLNGEMVAGPGIFIGPEKRGIGVVFQDYALFPHLRVMENMEFGLKHLSPAAKKERISLMMGLTGTAGMEKRFPHELSGGQKQRIALARALAPKPELILFDEPFSSIDSMRKNQMRREIKSILKKSGTTALFITHDTRDAMAMADRICMLRKGRNIQTGTPGQLYNKPVNAYVASSFGKTNLIRAKVTSGGLKTAFGIFPYNQSKWEPGETVILSVRPESFILKSKKKDCLCGNIVDRNFMGDFNELVCEVATDSGEKEELVVRIAPEKSCAGNQCFLKLRKNMIHVMNCDRGSDSQIINASS